MDPTCKLAGVNLFIFSTRGRKTSRKNQEEKPNIVTNFDETTSVKPRSREERERKQDRIHGRYAVACGWAGTVMREGRSEQELQYSRNHHFGRFRVIQYCTIHSLIESLGKRLKNKKQSRKSEAEETV